MVVGAVLLAVSVYFFTRTMTGKAILATSMNKDAARLVGIRTQMVFMVSALLGSIAGIVVAPITFTSCDIGITGFAGPASARYEHQRTAA
ncbi:MAG: hypothetical protein V7760_08390 [Marinobacter sp.]